LPLPLAPAVIVTQPTLLAAVQLHPLPAVTPTLPLPPPAAYDALVGEIEYVQEEVPACVTVTVWPATVIVPVRELVLVLAATVYLTVPLPLTLRVGLLMTIHEADEDADHLHFLTAVTVMVPVPPAAVKLALVGDTPYVHWAAAVAGKTNPRIAIRPNRPTTRLNSEF